MIRRIAFIALGLALNLSSPAFAQSPRPLFESDSVINIRIDTAIGDLQKRAKNSTDPYPGTLTLMGSNEAPYAVTVAARGKSRRTRGFCKFPPLRIRFPDKPAKTSLFRGQKSLKLVTHCRDRSSNVQNLAKEFAAYRLLNQITPQSLKVRMVQIEYFDSEKGKTDTTQYGFFIEDMDEAAERNGGKEIDVLRINRSQLVPDAAARTALFQYMIGNFDWAMIRAAHGNDCCHNTKLMGPTKNATSGFTPFPYDFDYSGLVDASYAEVPDNIDVRSVRTRLYRGYCMHNDQLMQQIPSFLSKQAQINATLASIPVMDDRTRRKTQDYLDDFFETLSDSRKVERELIGKCR